MNKLTKILISILAGIETVFYIVTPILIVLIWSALFGVDSIGSSIIYYIGLLASVFRGIKIGWLKK